jgi:hypothetical protein
VAGDRLREWQTKPLFANFDRTSSGTLSKRGPR